MVKTNSKLGRANWLCVSALAMSAMVSSAHAEDVKLTMWSWMGYLNPIIEAYEAQNPGVDIELLSVGNGHSSHLRQKTSDGSRRCLMKPAQSETTHRQELTLSCIQRSTIAPGQIELKLDAEAIADWLAISPQATNPDVLSFSTQFQFRKRGVETKLVIGTSPSTALDATLIRNIAKAHQYYDAIKQGQTFEQISSSENLSSRRVHQVIALAFLAPDIIKTIMQGEQPVGLTAQWLAQNQMPADWQAQRRIVARL